MIRQLSELRGFGYLFRNFLSRDLSSRYKGSLLGVVWSLMNPLVMMGIYTVVFSVIFRSKQADFAILLLAAYLPFFFFQTAVSLGVPTLVANAGLINKVYFPRELLPLSMTAASFVNFLFTMVLLLPAAIYAREGANVWALIVLIPIATFFFLATAGLVMLLAALNVYFRDVEFLIGIVLTAWFYVVPVIYNFTLIKNPTLRDWMERDPVVPFINAYRQAVFYKHTVSVSGMILLYLIAISAWIVCYAVFNRLKVRIAEEL
jgi:lipopolysaccharide transport system permease protein